MNKTIQKQKTKKEFPHMLVLFAIMILVASALTYIIPAGMYSTLPDSAALDPNSFQFIENTPVSPLDAFISLQPNLSSAGLVISLLLILGASTEVLVASGAINSLTDAGIARFKDKSITVVIPMIYLLMTVLGALCGNDSMIAYVAIGVAVSRKLKLDKLCAVSMFYLPYITAQAAGPTTAILLIAQSMLDIPPLTGAGTRIIVEILFYIAGATYTTMYALKVNRDPSRSILGAEGVLLPTAEDEEATKGLSAKFEMRAMLSVVSVVASYLIYAYGASNLGWSWDELCASILASSLFIGFLYKMPMNKIASTLITGATKMGGICFIMAFARTISATLTAGNIIHTIAYYSIEVLADMGSVTGALSLFVFNLLFNFLVVGGTTQAAIVLPVITPIADVVGISREVVTMVLQFGDGLTNCMTPLSGPLVGALAIAGVSYPQWIKFVWKIVLVNVAIAAGTIIIVMMAG